MSSVVTVGSKALPSPDVVPYALLLTEDRETPRSKSLVPVSNALFKPALVPYRLLLPERVALFKFMFCP